jgi:hypothetical protein
MRHIISIFVIFVIISLIFSNVSHAKIEQANIMGMWLFNDKGDVCKDSSKNANKSTVEGNPVWVDKGKFGGALSFDQVDDIIKVPMTVDYKEITVMCWVAENGSSTRPRIVSNDHTDVSNKGFQLMYNTAGSGSWFDIGTGGGNAAANFAYLATKGEWYHYTGTYDGSKIRAYINGEQLGEGATSGAIADSGIDVYIGSSTYGISDGLKGTLDEVVILNKALTADDIKIAMTNGLEKATGMLAVSSSGKLADTWGKIKSP